MALSFETSFDEYWQATGECLDSEFERALPRFFDRLSASHVGAVRDVLIGGKRLRGCLLCLVNDAFGGTRAAAIPRALAVECVHAASLIHDDLVDGDTSRRNRAATWTTEGPRRAVLLGDLMFANALRRMTELGRDDGLALAEAIAAMATGAYQEPLVQADVMRALHIDRSNLYAELISCKTGILFGTAARLGALAAGMSAALAALAFEYGARTGEAYQIADDLQDLVERPAEGPAMATQLALLAPALWHFCPESQLPHQASSLTREHAARLRPRLRSGMLAAIEARLQEAMAAAEQFPGGPHKVMLRSAPRAIVRIMQVGGP
jgi:hypothetical protein